MSKQLTLIEDEEAKKRKQRACEELVRLAELMETCESGQMRRMLSRDYKQAMKDAGIINNAGKVKGAKKIPPKDLAASKDVALAKVKEYLDDIERWEKELAGMATGADGYIAVSHLGTTAGMPCEVQLKICDGFYKSYSGYKCYIARVTLFSAKQGTGYASIHRGLVSFGLSLVSGEEKKEFFKKYAVPYNEKLNAKGDQNQKAK